MDKLDTPTISDGDAVVADDAVDVSVASLPEVGEVVSFPAPPTPSVPVEETLSVATDMPRGEVSEVLTIPAETEVAPDVVGDVPVSTPDPLFSNSPIRANSSTPPPSTPDPIPAPASVNPIAVVVTEPREVQEEPRVVERVVEKIVEKEVVKEVIKEVPVEKVVVKLVYRVADPSMCPPPTVKEVEAIKRDFLTNLSHEGTAKKHELMLEKKQKILALFDTKPTIMHKDVMELLDTSGTTATRLLTTLKHEGKIVQHGTGGNGASYTKPYPPPIFFTTTQSTIYLL